MEGLIVIGLLLIVILLVASSSQRSSSRPKDRSSSVPENVSPSSGLPPSARDQVDTSNAVVLSSLLPHQFIVLDLETTGLDPFRDEIIEFGAIRVSLDSDTHPSFQTLVKPERRIPKGITAITGITQEMVDDEGIGLADALTQFVGFIGELPIVTYNAEFDMGFIYSAARRHGVRINNRYTCALKRARRAWPDLPSHRLGYLAQIGKLPDEDSHRALGDCKRALIVFISATSRLNQRVRWSKPPVELV